MKNDYVDIPEFRKLQREAEKALNDPIIRKEMERLILGRKVHVTLGEDKPKAYKVHVTQIIEEPKAYPVYVKVLK